MKNPLRLIYHNPVFDAREKPSADKFYKKFGFWSVLGADKSGFTR
jgi:hypothetical protein